jgi:MFS transporter, SP family, general alpha glucoside:H+ symporter
LAKRNKGGICFLCVIYTYFRLPEPRGRSFAELDVLFELKVPARKFSSTEVDVWGETVEGGVMSEYQAKLHEERIHQKE